MRVVHAQIILFAIFIIGFTNLILRYHIHSKELQLDLMYFLTISRSTCGFEAVSSDSIETKQLRCWRKIPEKYGLCVRSRVRETYRS